MDDPASSRGLTYAIIIDRLLVVIVGWLSFGLHIHRHTTKAKQFCTADLTLYTSYRGVFTCSIEVLKVGG